MSRKTSIVLSVIMVVLAFGILVLDHYFPVVGTKKATTEAQKIQQEAKQAEQKAKDNERLTNQIIADKVVSELIFIQDPRNRVVYAYNKISGSMAPITGYSVPPDQLYVANVANKK